MHNSIVTLKNSESPLLKTNTNSKDELDDSIYFSTGHLKLISLFLIVSHNLLWNPQKLKHQHDQTVTKAKYLRWRFRSLQTKRRTSLRNSNKTEPNLTAKSGNQPWFMMTSRTSLSSHYQNYLSLCSNYRMIFFSTLTCTSGLWLSSPWISMEYFAFNNNDKDNLNIAKLFSFTAILWIFSIIFSHLVSSIHWYQFTKLTVTFTIFLKL